jgi:hypothetical protein
MKRYLEETKVLVEYLSVYIRHRSYLANKDENKTNHEEISLTLIQKKIFKN